MKKFNDLPIYFLIIGLVLNIALSLHARVSFIDLMIRSIVITILFTAMGFVLANVLSGAQSNIKKTKRAKAAVEEEVTTSSTFDVRVDSQEDELLRTLSQPEEDDFVEINPENFKRYMDQD